MVTWNDLLRVRLLFSKPRPKVTRARCKNQNGCPQHGSNVTRHVENRFHGGSLWRRVWGNSAGQDSRGFAPIKNVHDAEQQNERNRPDKKTRRRQCCCRDEAIESFHGLFFKTFCQMGPSTIE